MSSSQQFLTSPNPLPLVSTGAAFVSNWIDKRSAVSFGISLVIYSVGSLPDGYAWIELSNAPDQSGNNYGIPANKADDYWVASGSKQAITNLVSAATGTYGVQYNVYNSPAHWARLRYIPSGTASGGVYTGMSANVYAAVPFESP